MYLDDIFHSGVAHDANPPGRGSGRYAWGSGENPNQHQFNFCSEVKKLEKQGLTKTEIAKILLGVKSISKDGNPVYYTANDLKAQYTIELKAQKQMNRARALQVLDECHGNVSEAARRLGMKNESSLRSLLKESSQERDAKYWGTADFLKKKIDEKEPHIIDISSDTELYMGCSDYTKRVAVAILEREGYVKSWVQVPQLGTGKMTNITVLAAPPKDGETVKDVRRQIQQNKYNIRSIVEFTPDKGKTWWTPEFPESLDSKRIYIRYAEDGGKEKDGVIELRKGVEDISLGGTRYAQVRIAVDGTNYMKGMAIYSDDIPDGYDVVYNTNKHKGVPAIDTNAEYYLNEKTGEWQWSGKEVLKRLKINNETGEVDRDNPFGALIKSPKERDGVITAGGQRKYIGKDGKEHLSVINKLQDEGDWDSWSRTLSSQFLSKQPLKLINEQLTLSIDDKRAELEDILRLTNPIVRQKLLDEFASDCDANASDLSARGFKSQAFQVLLPVPKLKETEIYAPNYDNGEKVALIRYPHAGIFEIPVLTVNNHNPEAKSALGSCRDAVGINSKVADQLSGADFDGDTVIVIPLTSNRIDVANSPYPKSLKDFDPKELYKLPDSAPRISSRTKGIEMGKVTNLITDMTVQGAPMHEIIRAVKHSMVVIDAEKHHLDYKQSEKDYGIMALKEKYQKNKNTGSMGAATILSRASAEPRVPKRKEVTDVAKMTPEQRQAWDAGMKVYVPTGETRTTSKTLKDGTVRTKTIPKTENVSNMDLVTDATQLVRDPTDAKEMAYARYANNLKSLANQARREARAIKPSPVSQEARRTYAKEVESLKAKLDNAKLNNPRERQAQSIGNAIVSAKLKSNPDMDHEHKKRARAIALQQARAMVGAKKDRINITDEEWEAIQANAISTSRLRDILNNANQDRVKQLATPRDKQEVTSAQIARIKNLAATGRYSNKEIADALGISVSTVGRLLSQ